MEGCIQSLSASSSNSTSTSSSKLQALSKCWFTTKNIILSVQPSLSSEQRRKDAVFNIREYIIRHFGCQVFLFGSMPLKTYIPDGDIDLTVVTNQNVDDLATDIYNMLKQEGQKDTEFPVKNIKLVPAQVKILKCTVQNVAVDISFNQMAGLSALYFFEQVDRAIGKDHLFKQSLILVKSWCYYESRILGAHHGLLSTYALEILVLYIINFFYSSINGPLAVLYNFLSYFSTFQWDQYCVTLKGPVPISSHLPLSENMPKECEDQHLLLKDLNQICESIFLARAGAPESSERPFPIKDLNIMDPLNENNNLGRSVSANNFHRIQCALNYGAHKLDEILGLPEQIMNAELKTFFETTLDRNGRGVRPDLSIPVPIFGDGNFEPYDLTGDCDTSLETLHYFQWYLSNSLQFQDLNQLCPIEDYRLCYPNQQFPLAGYDLRMLSSTDFIPSSEMMHLSFENMHIGVRGETPESSSGVAFSKDPKTSGRIQQVIPSKVQGGRSNLMTLPSVVNLPTPSPQQMECSNEKVPLGSYKLQDNEDFPPLSNLVDASKKKNKDKGHR